jgi:hypothetical protein
MMKDVYKHSSSRVQGGWLHGPIIEGCSLFAWFSVSTVGLSVSGQQAMSLPTEIMDLQNAK